MVKEIKTENFEGIAVPVPTEIESFHIQYFSMAGTWLTESNSKNLNAWKVSLPFKNKQGKIKYEIIGKATELTEERCADIVDDIPTGKIMQGMNIRKVYKSYTSDKKCLKAKTSFETLLNQNDLDKTLTWLILKKLTK